VQNSAEKIDSSIIQNTLLDKLSRMYKRELANHRFIEEVEVKEKNDFDLPELNHDLGDIVQQNDYEEQLRVEYKTDEEDFAIAEEILGLKDIDVEEEKENSLNNKEQVSFYKNHNLEIKFKCKQT